MASAVASSGSHLAGAALKELNPRSAPIHAFDVSIFHPVEERYTYKDKKTNEQKSGSTFRCLLVCVDKLEQYTPADLTKIFLWNVVRESEGYV